MLSRPRIIPDPARVRRIRGSFGWIDHRLLRDGHLARMGLGEIALYLFLVLAADRDGVSWYSAEHVMKLLGLSGEEFHHARAQLIQHGLIAFSPFRPSDANGYFQLLPLDPLSGNTRG
jgi:hypothetical protein